MQDLTVSDAQENFHRLRSPTSEGAMVGGEPCLAVGIGGGVLDLPEAKQTYWDDIQARANTLGALPRRGNTAGY